jgi:1,4-dihydroxy-2-naphthoate polyprenyltransferase
MVNVAMWSRALRVIPRVSKEEWAELDVVSRWLIATRSAVLVMTFISSAIAGLLAFRDGAFNGARWAAVTLGLLFAHATNNLVNDLTDHARGVDKDNYFRAQYGPQPLEHGLMSRAAVLRYIAFTGAVAAACGVYLTYTQGMATLALFGAGVFFVLFYTWPLKLIGLGEIAVLAVWGPLMVGGGYYVITGHVDPKVIIASLPFALGATAVIFGKHIDKLDQDIAKRIRTLPVILGDRVSRVCVQSMLVLQYAVVAYLVAIRYFSPVLLLVGAAIPAFRLAWKAYSHPRPAAAPPNLPKGVWPLWFVALAFNHTRRFGGLYLLAIIADVVVRKLGWV